MFPSNEEIKIGMKVLVELKKDRGTGKLTEGIVQKKYLQFHMMIMEL